MTAARATWVLPLVVLAGAGAALIGRQVVAGGDAADALAPKWEYARLFIAEGQWVLTEAETELTIRPPGNPLPRQTAKGESSPTRYTADSRTVHNFEVGAMNFAGARGWEAVTVTPWGKGQMILLKRPAL